MPCLRLAPNYVYLVRREYVQRATRILNKAHDLVNHEIPSTPITY